MLAKVCQACEQLNHSDVDKLGLPLDFPFPLCLLKLHPLFKAIGTCAPKREQSTYSNYSQNQPLHIELFIIVMIKRMNVHNNRRKLTFTI